VSLSTPPTPSFGSLLRQYRRAAGLTQEELAERAGLGRATIDALERGTRQTPRKETVALLVKALALQESERALLEATIKRISQSTFTPSNTSEPRGNTSAIQCDVPIEATLPRILWTIGNQIPRLMSDQRSAALLSGLLMVVVLGGILVASGSQLLRGERTLCLATDLPIRYRYMDVQPIEDAVNLAVKQNQHLANGYTLKVINYDDASPETLDYDPQIGAHNIEQMIRNSCIVGMVGPFNTDVAVAEIPIAANARLTMISPSTTLSGLTLRPYAEIEGWNFDQMHPPGEPLNFFRIAPNDVAQGLVAANYVFDDLGARNVYIVNDRERFGEDIVGSFAQSFEVKGGRIVGIDNLSNGNLSAIDSIVTKIIEANPDAVFFAGVVDGGGLLRAQLVTRGYPGPFVGGEGIANDPGFMEVAGGNMANGTLAVAPFSHPSQISSDVASQFFRAFAATYPGETPVPEAAEAYDAAMVLIAAMKQLIQADQPVTRSVMIEQVQHIQYAGVSGAISFDTNGDIAHGIFSLYRVQNQVWTFVQQLST
jgi:branched-chain amino acid transport system substrate-binding protein